MRIVAVRRAMPVQHAIRITKQQCSRYDAAVVLGNQQPNEIFQTDQFQEKCFRIAEPKPLPLLDQARMQLATRRKPKSR